MGDMKQSWPLLSRKVIPPDDYLNIAERCEAPCGLPLETHEGSGSGTPRGELPENKTSVVNR